MFYRRKIILALLQIFEGQIDKVSLQKLLFLFTKCQTKADYDFIPYKYGCYSYSAHADLTAMINKGILTDLEKSYKSNETIDYFKMLKDADKKWMLYVKEQYGKMNADALMRHTYLNFPYWAINSEVASRILNVQQLEKVKNSRPKSNETILFTIGYEGISLEEYLNRLLKNDIKILVDVRYNPMSMKFGFSKSQIKRYCENLGIRYVHFPEVGIQSEQRQALNTQDDYDKLFAVYRQSNLTKTTVLQEKILILLKENKRIALTCFEANINQCHRKYLAEAIANLPSFEYEVKHI